MDIANKPREYVIKSVKKGSSFSNGYGEFQSYGMALEGIGIPVKVNKTMPVNMEPTIGDTLYGILIEEAAADGRTYLRFKGEKPPEPDHKQVSIHAQFAINKAVEIWIAQGCDTAAYDNIETEAKHFFTMIDTIIKGDR